MSAENLVGEVMPKPPRDAEALTARQRLDRRLGAFEPFEGRPPTMAGIHGLVDAVLRRENDDPNIVQDLRGERAAANGNIYDDEGSAEAGEAFVLPAAPLQFHGDRPSLGFKHEMMVKFVEMKLALDIGLCIFD